MQLGLEGKGVIVTGGSKGIGRSTALAFAREGAAVAICGRSEEPLRATEKELRELGGKVYAAECDVADAAALDGFIDAAAEALGSLNVLVNNASGFGITDNEDGWQRSFEVDVMATVRGTWKAAPIIAEAGGGAIIHISTISALQAAAMNPPYGALKAALMNHAQSTLR